MFSRANGTSLQINLIQVKYAKSLKRRYLWEEEKLERENDTGEEKAVGELKNYTNWKHRRLCKAYLWLKKKTIPQACSIHYAP